MSITNTDLSTSVQKFPTTESQKEIWISSKMGHDASCAYNESVQLGITGTCNVDLLKKSVESVIARHDALNTVFSNDGMWMLLCDSVKDNVAVVNIEGIPVLEQAEMLRKLAVQEVANSFDLEYGPLWSATIVIMSPAELHLFFTAHHIVCDGWSLSVLVDKILSTYSALLRNNAPGSVCDPSFGEYLIDRYNFSSTSEAEEHKQYWKDKFKQQVPTLELPTSKSRPTFRTYAAECVSRIVPSAVFAEIKKLAITLQCNPYTLFLGAYAILLHKLSGINQVVIGMPVSGQSFLDKKDLVGHCVNMLPVLCTVDPASSFSTFIDKLQDSLYDDFDHYTVTFGELVKVLNIQREPGRIPLMSTGLTYVKMKLPEELQFEDFNATYQINERSFETFEMQGAVIESGDERTFMWHFNTNLFDRGTIEKWLDAYLAILSNGTHSPECTIKELPILSSKARQDLVYTWNQTKRTLPDRQTIIHAIKESATQHPDLVAVEYCGQKCTYRMLETKSSQLAAILRKRHIGTGSVVAVCTDKNIDAVIALVAIMKVRAAYVPVDIFFPDERIAYIVSDCGAGLLITQKAYEEKYRTFQCEMLFIDELAEYSGDDQLQPENMPSPADIAYIIYTSGSSGTPKGVKIGHEALYNFLISMSETPGMKITDSILSVTTVSFDIAGLELFLPLLVGGRVVIAEKEIVADGTRLAQKIAAYRPTIVQATPSTWTLLLNSGWNNARGMTLLCGGEAMSRTLADKLLATGAMVWNMYGPTETTIWSSLWRVEPGTDTPSIGYPIANTQLYVLNELLQPVPTGVPGGLFIGGKGLAVEYHNRPDLTAEKFISDPFLGKDEACGCGRMYNTGDIAKRLADGSVLVLGRSDFQVKIRGFRIELGEIESVLEDIPGIGKAAVMVSKDTAGNDRLIGYLECRITMFIEDVREFLAKKLPGYMIPDQLIKVKEFPLTPNKKIDRISLSLNVHPDSLPTKMERVSPVNDEEARLLNIWQEVLKSTAFGTKDNFFSIGGNSILIVEIQMLIKEKLGCDIALTSLFQYPTIESLAASFGSEKNENQKDSGVKERMNLKQRALNRRRDLLKRDR